MEGLEGSHSDYMHSVGDGTNNASSVSQSEDKGQIRFRNKNNQITSSGDDQFSKACDDLMIAEGGLEDEVENWGSWNRVKRRLSNKDKHVSAVTVKRATIVVMAILKLREKIKK